MITPRASGSPTAGSPTLSELKTTVREKFLGRAGLHGVGVSESDGCLKLYVSHDGGDQQQDLIAEIERLVAPTPVKIEYAAEPKLLAKPSMR